MAVPTHTTPPGVNDPSRADIDRLNCGNSHSFCPGVDTKDIAATYTPDAQLIGICDEIADLNRHAEALDDVDEANLARWEELSGRAATMPAETLDGLRARLRAIGPHIITTEFPGTAVGELRAQLIAAADELCRFAVGHTGTAEELHAALAAYSDADLIATCVECERLEMEMLALFEGPREIFDDKERDAAIKASGNDRKAREMAEVIASTPAKTLAGLRAKGRALVASYPSIVDLDDGAGGLIETSIIRDLVGDFDPIALVGGTPA